jgi:hypothetical protein
MLSRIHERLGTAGFVISIVAVVLALTGGAYAAGKLNATQKKEVEKIAKKFAGKPGANGAPGLAGPAGAKGDTGTAGANGTNGVSVTGKPIPTSSASCSHHGGTELTSATGTEKICNGATGFTETLPPEKTETGTWAITVPPGTEYYLTRVSISFPIPLVAGLPASAVHFVESGEAAPAGCEGGTATNPAAEPGNLCVYAGGPLIIDEFEGIFKPDSTGAGAGPTGALVELGVFEELTAGGTFAVTAESE